METKIFPIVLKSMRSIQSSPGSWMWSPDVIELQRDGCVTDEGGCGFCPKACWDRKRVSGGGRGNRGQAVLEVRMYDQVWPHNRCEKTDQTPKYETCAAGGTAAVFTSQRWGQNSDLRCVCRWTRQQLHQETQIICALSLVTANINDQRNLFHISRLCVSPTAKLSFSWDVNRKNEGLRDRGLFLLVWSSSNLYLCDLLIYYICCWLLNISIYFYLCLIISLLSWVNFTDFYRFWSMNESPARRVERDYRKMKTDFSSSVVVMSEPPQSCHRIRNIYCFIFNVFFKYMTKLLRWSPTFSQFSIQWNAHEYR